MTIAEETSQKIKNMSIICAMLVVTIHVGWPHKTLCPTWFIYQLVAEGVAQIAVPFFFIVSGFFLSAHFDEPNWHVREIKKRIHTLLIPFFVWSSICFVAFVPLSIVADLVAHRPFGTCVPLSNGRWIHTFGLDVNKTPALSPLWYVRCLFFFVLASPLFKAMTDRFGKIWLFATFILATVFESIRTPTDQLPFWEGFFTYGISFSGIFYFSLGIYIRKLRGKINKGVAVMCFAVGAALIITSSFLSYRVIHCPIRLESISLPFLIYGIWDFIPSAKWPSWLTSCSFSIFLLHCILLQYSGIFLEHLPLNPQLVSAISYTAAIVGSIIMTNLCKRFFPNLTHFLFAGRS